MSPPSRRQLKRGAYGYGDNPEDADFLKPDNERGNWVASASGVGYNAKFSDDDGFRRGQGAYTDENEDGLKPVNRLPDEQREVSDKLRDIMDDVDGMGSGNVITGGGGPLTKKYGVGSGPPKVKPKTGPRTNSRD
jgi:hypothetical protein